MPSIALTAPSCIAPLPLSDGSSSCSAMTPPASRWYCSALRSIPAETTGLPSSVKPSAPSARSSAISVSSLPLQAAGDRGHEADGDPRVAGGGVAQGAQHRRGVDDGVGVRHRHDGAVAARRGGAGAGLDVLLVLLAGHAKVDVRVDEGGQEVAPAAVDDLGARRRGDAAGRADLRDAPVADEDVVRGVDPRARVEHVGRGDQDLGGRGGRLDERAAPGRRARLALMRSTAPRSARARSPCRRGPRRGPPSGRRSRTRPAS